jgi:hypothetical protein
MPFLHFEVHKFCFMILHKLYKNSVILKVYDEGAFKLNNYHLQKNYIVMGS